MRNLFLAPLALNRTYKKFFVSEITSVSLITRGSELSTPRSQRETWLSSPLAPNTELSLGCHSTLVIGPKVTVMSIGDKLYNFTQQIKSSAEI